jgi:hypothetical protein
MRKSNKEKLIKQNLSDAISDQDAAQILKILYAQDAKMAARIEQVANDYLGEVDAEQIAKDVYSTLDRLDVTELSQRAGSGPYGYTEPSQMAYDMFAEVVDPFLVEMKKYQKLSKPREAKLYCLGILKGIDRYEKEARPDFKDWVGDGIMEHFYWILDEWKKGCRSSQERKEMKEFVGNNFPPVD